MRYQYDRSEQANGGLLGWARLLDLSGRRAT
jgi:hypothetical protein